MLCMRPPATVSFRRSVRPQDLFDAAGSQSRRRRSTRMCCRRWGRRRWRATWTSRGRRTRPRKPGCTRRRRCWSRATPSTRRTTSPPKSRAYGCGHCNAVLLSVLFLSQHHIRDRAPVGQGFVVLRNWMWSPSRENCPDQTSRSKSRACGRQRGLVVLLPAAPSRGLASWNALLPIGAARVCLLKSDC